MGLADDISNWIKIQVKEAKAEGVVVGLSGGVDSSVVAALSKKALGDRVLGLIMPCQSESEDYDHAILVALRLKLKTERVALETVYNKLLETLPSGNKLAMANLKPRLRMITLYYFANNLNYLVAGTGNKSEIMVGYFTKYGDGGVDILPLGGLLKSEVRELAWELDIPKEIIEKVPSAGLWPGQTDEGELGIGYDELDRAILALESGNREDLDSHILAKVEDLIKASSHKRSLARIYIKQFQKD
ncbi:MAG: NAD+ synthase [bacterium]|nr:NAD+ synthase [bacterium]